MIIHSDTTATIRQQARQLGFEDWATADLAVLEPDVRASHILKLSKQLRTAAERNDLAQVLSFAQAIVEFLQGPVSEPFDAER